MKECTVKKERKQICKNMFSDLKNESDSWSSMKLEKNKG